MSNSPYQDNSNGRGLLVAEQALPAIELKGAVFTLTVLRIQSNDLRALEDDLIHHLGQAPRFFENAPVVLDFGGLGGAMQGFDINALLEVVRRLKLIPVGARNAAPEYRGTMAAAGLAIMTGGAMQEMRQDQRSNGGIEPPQSAADSGSVAVPEPTKVVQQTVRSGQQIYAAGGDLIVLSSVNAGAEVIADGNIHIYGPLRGRALAGVRGNSSARIFCQSLQAELIAIAGNYQVYEEQMPKAFHRTAVQIVLRGNELKITPLEKGKDYV